MIGIDQLCAVGIVKWKQTRRCDTLASWYVDEAMRRQNEAQGEALLQEFLPYWQAFPTEPRAQNRWRQKGAALLDGWLHQAHHPLFADMNQNVGILFRDITVTFLRDVRRFDRQLSLNDAMQALRNVWIIAVLQCLFQKPVGYHEAMFAYSMLYPYTDNYLDDVSRSMMAKQVFNVWLNDRLHGIRQTMNNDHERKIDRLVTMIERRFPRCDYPQVYESLYAIQAAQERSLYQQDGEWLCDQEELLAISYEKGGTSVVADGMLIDGKLNDQQLAFCMDYGFMLQLGDDIQDASTDRRHHHQTLASMYPQTVYDPLIGKLFQYVEDICADFAGNTDQSLLAFVAQNCRYLIFASLMQENAITISLSLMQELQRCLPVSRSWWKAKQKNWDIHLCDEECWKRLDVLLQ